jgi:hypothetical protein
MRVQDRIEQFMVLAVLSDWNREEMETQAKTMYPHGPSVMGTGWPQKLLDEMWKAIESMKAAR